MPYQSKYEQLNKQSSLLAKKLEEIKKKQANTPDPSSSTKANRIDTSGDENKVVTINNDGNFMENFLKMENEKKSQSYNALSKKDGSNDQSATLSKKSRYSSMFQQMKKVKQPITPAVETPITCATATCFHGDDSSSDDEPPTKMQQIKVKAVPVTKSVHAAKINPVSTSAGGSSSSVPSSSSTVKPITKERTRPRKNRWGDKVDLSDIAPPGLADMPGVVAPPVPAQSSNLGLFQAFQLNETQRKQLQEQKDMQAMYNLIMANRNASQIIAAQNAAASAQLKPKYQYDSDEEIDEKAGTWEHRKRRLEMEKTQALAEKLTDEGEGKHFIGDFLPPAELDKFMETFEALKEGRTPDYSDYKEFKIQCDNIGFKMLEKMGWSEGQGLGNERQGIKLPVNQGSKSLDGRGLGIKNPDNLTRDDDDFSAYRKRMMLAYKFRPNPLNNPRRPYY